MRADAAGQSRDGRAARTGPSPLPVLIVLLVVVGLGVGAFLLLGGPRLLSGAGERQEQAASSQEPAGQQGAGDAGGQPDADTQQPAQPDPRDAEFAVDPARTDWVFSAGDVRTVYLTFDDGPSENTQPVLDILDQYGVKATFFVTGMHPDFFPLIHECYARGHTIGMHTYSHEYDQVYASTEAYWADLNAIADVVRGQIGYVPCFIRFPGGSSNTISASYTPGIMTELSQEVVAAGYQYYDWDASCGDGADHTADELVAATQADTAYGYASIVFLMHDAAGKETTVEALPRIIEYFRQQGYEFSAIDRGTCVPHHGIGN